MAVPPVAPLHPRTRDRADGLRRLSLSRRLRLVNGLNVTSGGPSALRLALAERVAKLRLADPLAPISLLVETSLQRPHLGRWLAARLGGHANVRILMPGDLALFLG